MTENPGHWCNGHGVVWLGSQPYGLPGESYAPCPGCRNCKPEAEVAALYVDPNGVYANLPGIEVWDEARDARTYPGPWPVVAHPPCAKWSPLAYINQRRLPNYRVGDDGGCFAAALAAVRTWGGVLEHPAGSLAWRRHGLERPLLGLWMQSLTDDGWTCEVEQGAYGHRARKLTWLYYVGPEPPDLIWLGGPYSAIVSGFTHQAQGEHVACEHRRVRPREASATPPAFRDVLLAMARSAEKVAHERTHR